VTPLLARRLLFVSGKGGTGKSTVAAALAELAVQRGLRTLVCEMDAKGALAGAFEVADLRFAPREIHPGLFAMVMNTEDSLREYLRLFVRIPLVGGRLGPLAHMFDFVADAAPGVKEILGVGKLCYEVRERHYDVVIVDAEASGHIVAQIDAPRAIRELVQVGMVREQTDWMLEILDDPVQTGLVVVTTPEEMPVAETVELVDRVRSVTGVDVAAVIANRVLPQWFTLGGGSAFSALTSPAGLPVLTVAAGAKVSAVVHAARLTHARSVASGEHLAHLRRNLPASIPVFEVPELFTRSGGRRVVSLVAGALAAPLADHERNGRG
jgi:anion-transporting  ArsA/GET3 family ATPase